jgi:Zn-dependent M28 family amino/carboxypeptidase
MRQSRQLNSIDAELLRDKLSEHVDVLARVIGDRNLLTRYTALESAARYVESALAQIGYQTSAQVYEVADREVRNIEVESHGTSKPEEILVIGAHYDSVPGCPAANDNASGVAGVLELARHFRTISTSRTLRFVAFVNEEPPYFHTELMGSLVYARRCRKQGENIVGMISLETIGCYSDAPGSQTYPLLLRPFFPSRGNFIAFVGDRSARRFVKRVGKLFRLHSDFPMQRAAAPGFIPGIGWSDHWSFSQVGYPALMVTDTAPFRYRYYHTAQDTSDKLDYERMARVVAGVGAVVKELADS